MTELDGSCVLASLSPTYMPYFPPHHSPLNSSSNTRQRDDYELNHSSHPPSTSPQVLVTLTDDDDYDPPPPIPDTLIEGYPAWELPFASEPALEGELEQGLPPLKKLKPNKDYEDGSASLEKKTSEGIVLFGAVKGILTRRTISPPESTLTSAPLVSSPISSETCFASWSRTSPTSHKTHSNTLPLLNHSVPPLSRRSSSGASSACTGSLKAVRFASGNAFENGWNGTFDQGNTVSPGEIEGPVAAIMYLTHSSEAYDRSPIVVEDCLRLPPRAKDDDDDDVVATHNLSPKSSSPDKKRRAKFNLKVVSIPSVDICTTSRTTSPLLDRHPESPLCEEEECSIVIKSPKSPSKAYRETEEADEEEEIDSPHPDQGESKDDDDEDEEDHQNSKDGDSDHEEGRSCNVSWNSSNDSWGLGKWSSGEVFGCCDALGGF